MIKFAEVPNHFVLENEGIYTERILMEDEYEEYDHTFVISAAFDTLGDTTGMSIAWNTTEPNKKDQAETEIYSQYVDEVINSEYDLIPVSVI
jgi:hypothetical protein